ncbi:MAG: hypothetical protein SOX69_09710 [Oscillospiraceae bacterium]|nr:hypothetical protein [Oscillospiraceae bacterium]
MAFINLQLFAEGGETGLSGDFDADFAKYVLGGAEEAERDKAEQNADAASEDAPTDETDENADGTAENADETEQNADENADENADGDDGDEMSDEEFEKLISGKGKKAFGAKAQKLIDGKFEKVKGQMQPLEALAGVLYDRYGVEKGDVNALTEAVYNDGAMFSRQALDAGVPVSEYRENFKAARGETDSEDQNEPDEQADGEDAELIAQNDLISAWQTQADEVKATFPDFDLAAELSGNESFRQLLTGERPLTVEEARRLAYYDRDIAAISGRAAQSAKEKTAQAIAQNRTRPAEGGLTGRSGGIVQKKDVSALKDNDILNILDAVSRGAKISF